VFDNRLKLAQNCEEKRVLVLMPHIEDSGLVLRVASVQKHMSSLSKKDTTSKSIEAHLLSAWHK
jgi:hypothetical protein